MRRLPKMAAALLAAALAVSAALPALAADQRAELELEASVRCTGEAADETLTVRLTALDGARCRKAVTTRPSWISGPGLPRRRRQDPDEDV